MDKASQDMLEEARFNYQQLGVCTNPVQSLGEHTSIIATRTGTVKTSTLALALRSFEFSVEQHDGFLLVEAGDETQTLQGALEKIASGDAVDLFAGSGNLMSEKFHTYLSADLLALDAASSKLAPHLLSKLAREIVLNT